MVLKICRAGCENVLPVHKKGGAHMCSTVRQLNKSVLKLKSKACMVNGKASGKPFCVDTYKCKDDNRPKDVYLELSVNFGYNDYEKRESYVFLISTV